MSAPSPPGIAPNPVPRPWRRAAAAALALLCLNGLLGFRSGGVPGSVLADSRLAPEFVVMWLLLLLGAAADRRFKRTFFSRSPPAMLLNTH